MRAHELGLIGPANSGALALEAEFPGIDFTSGRRGVRDQARAMASNLVLNRRWIAETYTATPESQALQAAVLAHPDAKTQDQIAAVLSGIMGDWTDAQRGKVSKHFSGQAFDVRPETGPRADRIKAFIRRLPGLTKFLETEGGLTRWHAQFA